MVQALLYDHLGYVVGEPDVPSDPPPMVVIWGHETFIAGCLGEDGRPHYHWAMPYVIPDTRELPSFH